MAAQVIEADQQQMPPSDHTVMSGPDLELMSMHSTLISRQQIKRTLADIEADIKSKRQNDLNILCEVKKEIMAQEKVCVDAKKSCQMLDAYMNKMHELRGHQLEKAVSLLLDALQKTEKSEEELDQSKSSLSLLFQDIGHM